MVSGAADYANITLSRDGTVARLVLNRPDRRNALTHQMMLELEDAFGRVRDDQTCRVLVLRGAGGNFCAGGDLDVTGRVIDGTEAYRLGVGRHFCANTADLNRTLKAVLDDILKLEPQALATVKRLVLSSATAEDRAVLDDAAESLVGLLRRPQASEGIKAFMAKAAPPWNKE